MARKCQEACPIVIEELGRQIQLQAELSSYETSIPIFTEPVELLQRAVAETAARIVFMEDGIPKVCQEAYLGGLSEDLERAEDIRARIIEYANECNNDIEASKLREMILTDGDTCPGPRDGFLWRWLSSDSGLRCRNSAATYFIFGHLVDSEDSSGEAGESTTEVSADIENTD